MIDDEKKVIRFIGNDDGIHLANDTFDGLGASLWTRNVAAGSRRAGQG